MVTPVGHSALESCASFRAALSRVEESVEFRVLDEKRHRVPVNCASVAGVTDGQRRFLRHYRMAIRAFSEAVESAGLEDLGDCGVYLSLCEPARIEVDSRIQDQMAPCLGKALEEPGLESRTQVFTLGHAGIFRALEAAVADLASGRVQAAIAGAVDSYLDEATLDWLAEIKRLKTDRTVVGLVPGEGAAFVVLEGRAAAAARSASPLAKLDGVATAMESHGIYGSTPCRGDGLTSALERTLGSLPDRGAETSVVLCDLNGERYRATEWGLTLFRALGSVRYSPAVWHPAGSTGDTGAAAGAINVAFAAVAVAKGYAHPQNVLVWGSSDEGLRGSAYLRRADVV
jgi:3-oxoacyl-[acyl-carrier-protein] synthase-1